MTSPFTPVITVDSIADAAYIKLSDEPVVETRNVSDAVLVDLDRHAVAVGVEVLSLDAEIPFIALTADYHMHSSVIDLVQTIRPSIGGFVSTLTQGTDGTSSASQVGDFAEAH